MIDRTREHLLTEETIVKLVQLVAEEIGAVAGQVSGRLEAMMRSYQTLGSVSRGSTRHLRRVI